MASPPPSELYADRDPRKLEPHYSRHVGELTRWHNGKAEIAAELAFRDKEIVLLYGENVALRSAIATLLTLDAERPLDPLYWRRHWDAAREEAETLLGIPPRQIAGVQP